MIPQFAKETSPVLQQDTAAEGLICSITSGVLREGGIWRLWYSSGYIGADQAGAMRVFYAESADGRHWLKPALAGSPVPGANIAWPRGEAAYRAYLPSVHREKDGLVAFIWCDKGHVSGLFRFVSTDGENFEPAGDRPLIAPHWASPEDLALAGEGRVSNDAYSVLQNPDGSYSYFSAYLQPNTDPRATFADDDLTNYMRVICRADSPDGISWTPTKVIIEPDYAREPYETQFYGMHVFRHGGLYLGLLHVYLLEQQIIQPQWAWSRDGWDWHRTHTPCIQLGAPGSFDSRMIVFGDTEVCGGELVWLYNGGNWKHDDYARSDVRSCIGRAALPLHELDAWTATLAV